MPMDFGPGWGGVIPGSRGLVGTSGSRCFHPRPRFPAYSPFRKSWFLHPGQQSGSPSEHKTLGVRGFKGAAARLPQGNPQSPEVVRLISLTTPGATLAAAAGFWQPAAAFWGSRRTSGLKMAPGAPRSGARSRRGALFGLSPGPQMATFLRRA